MHLLHTGGLDKAFLITSARPREGKTTIAAAPVQSLAYTGRNCCWWTAIGVSCALTNPGIRRPRLLKNRPAVNYL
jgi:hypothetical protein